jgi:gliding motility-associated-like protein
MKTKILFFSILLFFSLANKTSAQGEANIWYFGNYAGLDFNGGAPVAITNGALQTNEGCAVISTNDGALRFYTAGVTIYISTHVAMPNGNGLLGSYSATQSATIVSKPGNPNIFYVFTVDAFEHNYANGLRYSEVDMSLSEGLGDVTANKNIFLASSVTEKIIAVKKANNNDIWLIAHDLKTDAFLVYSITKEGINKIAVKSNAGTIDAQGTGYLKASFYGSKLVQALHGVQKVDVLNFNKLTGVVTTDFTFPAPFTRGGVYGVEFSADGKKLYVASIFFECIYQYDLALHNSSAIISSAKIIGKVSSPHTLGALQMAPDGKIYLAKLHAGTLGCINNPSILGVGCGFVDNSIYLLGKTSSLGLPNINQTCFSPAPITYNNTCLGDITYFSLSVQTETDSVLWNFNNPLSGNLNISELLSPLHIFTNPGKYTVSAIIYSGSDADTATVAIEIKGCGVNDHCVSSNISDDFVTPKTFSPGSNSDNNFYNLKKFENCIATFSLIIFDQFGEKIFESENPGIGWDGTNKGKSMDSAVFIYSINAMLITGEKINKKGNISLIR